MRSRPRLWCGARHQLSQEDFVAMVKAETGGKGVDVILDMVGGDYVQRNIAAAAPWGRIVNIAYQNGFRTEVDFTQVLTKRLTLAATTLRGRTADQKRAIRDALLHEVWPRLGTGVRPVIDRVFPLEQAQASPSIHGQNRPYRQNPAPDPAESLCAERAAPLKDRIPRKD